MAETRLVVMNDLLCFCVNKLSRIGVKPLKNVCLDFFTADQINIARESVFNEVEKLQLSISGSKLPRKRRDSANKNNAAKTATDLDDIVDLLIYLDEQKFLDKLPIYVCGDPDKIPSIKLTDGDLAIVLLKLSSIDDRIDLIQKSLDTVINSIKNHEVANAGANIYQGISQVRSMTGLSHNALETSQDVQVTRDYSGPSMQERSSVFPAASDMSELSDVEGFKTMARKRKKLFTPPDNRTVGISFASAVSKNARPPGQAQTKRPVMIGSAASSSIKASKTIYLNKAVFCLSNVDLNYSCDDIMDYLKSINVRPLTCFDLRPNPNFPVDSKAFRICIVDEDKQFLLNNANWAVGVTIRPWVRKTAKDNTMNTAGIATANQAVNGSSSAACTNLRDQNAVTAATGGGAAVGGSRLSGGLEDGSGCSSSDMHVTEPSF